MIPMHDPEVQALLVRLDPETRALVLGRMRDYDMGARDLVVTLMEEADKVDVAILESGAKAFFGGMLERMDATRQQGMVRVETLAMLVIGGLAGYVVIRLAMWVGDTIAAGAQAVS